MRIRLVSDSVKRPNLALMKFSTWAKQRNHTAGWWINDPTHILISCIFKRNLPNLLGMAKAFPNAQIIAGGPGYDPSEYMPPEIEKAKPDYSLYPKYRDSLGFVTAGCKRHCPFCIVPKMQSFHFIQDVWKFYRGGICNIMDDNILFAPKIFKRTAEYLIENNIKTHFEYLDIRLIQEESAQLLSEINHTKSRIYFSYDIRNQKTKMLIKKNVRILEDAGIKPRRLTFFLYIHSKQEKDIIDAMHRWRFLIKLGVEPFGMCNRDNIKDYKLKKRVTRPAIWRGMTAEEVFRWHETDFTKVEP